MKRTLLAPYVAKGLMWLLGIGAVAAMAVQGLYLFKFVVQPGEWFALSSNKSDWGTYGDFVGGTLNPIFSFLAFVGVVLTVVLQARQLDEVKAQAELEEMQRVASTVAARVDQLLAQDAIGDLLALKLGTTKMSLFNLIAAGGTKRLQELAGRMPEGWLGFAGLPSGSVFAQVLDAQTTALRIELESLSWMVLRYQSEGGSQTVLDYYRFRYQAVSCWLDALGLLDTHKQVQSFYKPQDVRPAMMPSEVTQPTTDTP